MAKSPIGWVGGKRLLVPRLLELMPQHYQTYVEPFCGGAALYFAKEQQGIEVLNDLDGELVNFYRCVVTNCDEMESVFEGFNIERVSIGYAINRDANITKGELIVRNYYGKH